MVLDRGKLKNIQRRNLLILLFVFGLVFLYVIRNFIGIFILTFVIATIANPLYQRLLRRTKREILASIITTLAVIIFIILPFYVILNIGIGRLFILLQSLNNQIESGDINIESSLDSLLGYLESVSGDLGKSLESESERLIEIVFGLVDAITKFIGKSLIPFLSAGIGLVVKTFIFVILLLFTFPSRDKMLKYLSDISPFEKQIHNRFIKRYESVTRATFLSTVASMAVSGGVNGAILFILSVPSAGLLSVILFFGAIIPFVSGFLVFGISLYLILSGAIAKGLFLYAWATIVSGNLDNIVRIKILRRGGQGLPNLLTLLSILGGIQTFGPFIGFLYGPIIASFLYTGLLAYREEVGRK